MCDISNIYTCRHKITCFNAQCQIINSRIDFRSAGFELSSCTFSLRSLLSVLCKRVLFPIFFQDKGARNNKRCFYYNVTVEILSLFRLGRGTSQQSKYLAAYLSREVSSWQCDIRRYENNFYYTLQLGKGDIYLQFSEYYFTVQDHSMACFILFFLCIE